MNSELLWQKPGVEIDARIMRFLAGDDVVLDREFFLHDITASKAHVEGLGAHRRGQRRRIRRALGVSWMRSAKISATANSCSTSATRTVIRRSRRA